MLEGMYLDWKHLSVRIARLWYHNQEDQLSQLEYTLPNLAIGEKIFLTPSNNLVWLFTHWNGRAHKGK